MVEARGQRGHEQNTNKELDGRFSRNGGKDGKDKKKLGKNEAAANFSSDLC